MRNVVLDRETVESVRYYLRAQRARHAPLIPCIVSQSLVNDIDRLLSPLDAALAAPEPFERREGGAFIIGDETFAIILSAAHGCIDMRYCDYIGDNDQEIEVTRRQSRAVALALLEMTEATP